MFVKADHMKDLKLVSEYVDYFSGLVLRKWQYKMCGRIYSYTTVHPLKPGQCISYYLKWSIQ